MEYDGMEYGIAKGKRTFIENVAVQFVPPLDTYHIMLADSSTIYSLISLLAPLV